MMEAIDPWNAGDLVTTQEIAWHHNPEGHNLVFHYVETSGVNALAALFPHIHEG
jgi:hypothetical protein